jgi:hypothetical protein
MRYLIILSFLLAALNAQTQNRIQLRDGSLIEYKKSKKRGDKKLFQLPSKEWKEVSSDDIVCYCNADGQIRYQQPVGLSEIDKLLEGRINVYIGYDMGTRVYTNGAFTPAENVYYVERDGEYLQLETRAGKRRAFLDSLFRDSTQPVANIQDDDRVTIKDMLAYIREYNLQFFTPLPLSSFERQSSVVFFANANKKESLQIEVNDSERYVLPVNVPLTIQIPVDVYSKVCVVTKDGKFCDLVSASGCTIRHIEVRLNDKRGQFELENSTRTEAQKLILQRRSQL